MLHVKGELVLRHALQHEYNSNDIVPRFRECHVSPDYYSLLLQAFQFCTGALAMSLMALAADLNTSVCLLPLPPLPACCRQSHSLWRGTTFCRLLDRQSK